MKTIKLHPQTNGGKAITTVKTLLEENPKDNRFLAMCILKGLGLEVDFISMSKVIFTEDFEIVGGLRSPLITVSF